MAERSETSYILHDIIPLFERFGYPGAGDHERVRINDVPVLRPSGGRSGSTMDIVYYHNGEPLLIVEAKRDNKSHKKALDEAQKYRRNFPVELEEFAPSGRSPQFIATVVGSDLKFFRDVFVVENNQLKQAAEQIGLMKFQQLLEFYGLVPKFQRKTLTPDLFRQVFLSELIRAYDVGGRSRVSPQLVVKISQHILNYLQDSRKYIHDQPFTGLDEYLHKQKSITELHARYDLTSSLSPGLALEYRRFLVRAFQGTRLNQYLTPLSVISFMVEMIGSIKKSSRLIDFECGSGGFLAFAIQKYGLALNNVLGIDIDDKPVVFAKVFLSFYFSLSANLIGGIPIKRENGLLYDGTGWDIVIGNPAGSAQYLRKDISKVLMHLNIPHDSKDSSGKYSEYDFSIRQAIGLAKPGGLICMVVPEGPLSNANDGAIRDFISSHCRILAIVSLPRGIFKKGVTSKTSSSGGQTATMKMNILLLSKAENRREIPDDYPLFLAQIQDPISTSSEAEKWLEPRLALVHAQWRQWLKTGGLSPLSNELIETAEHTEIRIPRKRDLFQDPNQEALI